jgi:effector-binding domain-containing protein
MIAAPIIVQANAQSAAAVHVTAPRIDIQNAMGPAIGEVYATLAAQGMQPTGPWFTYHLQAPSYLFDFHACVPIDGTVMPVGRVTNLQRPAATVACAVYQGDYSDLGPAWSELHAWIKANGRMPASTFWESYLIGPDTTLDPQAWRTELNQSLI